MSETKNLRRQVYVTTKQESVKTLLWTQTIFSYIKYEKCI